MKAKRKAPPREKSFYSRISSKLGPIIYTHDGRRLLSIYLGKGARSSRSLFSGKTKRRLKRFESEIDAYLHGKLKEFRTPLRLDCKSDFRMEVLKKLKEIPYGTLVTYRDLASMARRPRAQRAVGNAVGANPFPIVIPCHRVIRSDGTIGGFGCGISYKRKLLRIEKTEL